MTQGTGTENLNNMDLDKFVETDIKGISHYQELDLELDLGGRATAATCKVLTAPHPIELQDTSSIIRASE